VTQQALPVRLRASSGSSTAADAVEAGVAAATDAIAGLDGATPALIIVYATVRYDLPELLRAIRTVTGDAPLVGESTAGQLANGTLMKPGSGVSVLAMTAGDYRFGFGCVEHLSETGGVAAGRELARTARAGIGPDGTPFATLMIFTDGLANEQQTLVTGLHQVTGAAIPVVGGAAADDRHLSETFVFFGDQALSDAAVAVWIGSDHPIPVSVGHGWHSIGLPLLVTKTDGQVVEEIAGRPAYDVFDEHIRRGNADETDHLRPGGYYSTHAFGMIEPDGSHLIRGVFMTDDRIHTFSPLPVYAAVQIMGCNPEDLLTMSRDVAKRAIGDRDPSLMLVFSCIARMDILKDRAAEEAAVLQEVAGDVPTFGVYTYGEFARTTSVAGYHNATVAAIAL
jgi:hypothetical protein